VYLVSGIVILDMTQSDKCQPFGLRGLDALGCLPEMQKATRWRSLLTLSGSVAHLDARTQNPRTGPILPSVPER
jgi:hypothetical protein